MSTLDEFLQSNPGLDPGITESLGEGSGRAFLGDFLGSPPLSQAREDAILAAVTNGAARVLWGTLTTSWTGRSGTAHTATLFVMRDALAVGTADDFVRASVRCDTAQRIADALGAQLLTPHVADMIFDQADVKSASHPQNAWVRDRTMSSTRRMIDYQNIVQGALEVAGAKASDLVANSGKHWVVTNRLWEPGRAGKAANYGWYSGPTSQGGLAQPVELGHGFALWVDYSQLVQLMGATMIVDGALARTADVMMDPELHGLVSSDFIRSSGGGQTVKLAEGVMRGFRYPPGG